MSYFLAILNIIAIASSFTAIFYLAPVGKRYHERAALRHRTGGMLTKVAIHRDENGEFTGFHFVADESVRFVCKLEDAPRFVQAIVELQDYDRHPCLDTVYAKEYSLSDPDEVTLRFNKEIKKA